jgi:UDP-glucose 4-epimerase
MTKKIFISGGAGFIGTNLISKLIKSKESIITVFDDFSNSYPNFRKIFKNEIKGKRIKIIKSDLINKQKLFKAIKNHHVVYHLAANSDISLAINNPLIDFKGTQITSNILEACRLNKIQHIIYTSGSGIYGDTKKTLYENKINNLEPVSFYGASKLACEGLMSAYSHMYNMKITVFRMANIIGKYSTHGVIYDFLKKLKKNKKKLLILGNGTQNKSYLHVEDLITAFLNVTKKQKKKYDIFNVSTDDLITVNKIANTIFKVTNLKTKKTYTGGNIGWKGDVSYIKLSNKKLKKIGWNYKYNTSLAVEKTIKENIYLLNGK